MIARQLLVRLRPAVVALVVFTLVTGVVFPAIVWAVAQVFFPFEAQGSLIVRRERVVGSRLIAQRFTQPRYFHPRPSAIDYDAATSGGSNQGPFHPKLAARVRELTAQFRSENGLGESAEIPADAVTTSGSGFDPDISLSNALLQLPRVANARGMDRQRLERLLDAHDHGARINVLVVNLALDDLP